jgi:hypothetical protein
MSLDGNHYYNHSILTAKLQYRGTDIFWDWRNEKQVC